MENPKLFISYSWSDVEHEQWVIDLATELRESGVDVILDKWDLKEGHDSVVFMEKMVTDPEIKKVAIICDETYAAKADGRFGGVGTETQIISKEVYENQSQEKFVAIVCGKDENGKAYLPTYYKSRIYIDLSEADRYADNFERLLRWIFDKPLYEKPKIGKRPHFLSEDNQITLGTTATFKRCVDAIKNHKSHAAGAFDEYCTIFADNLERIRISNPSGEFDDAVVKNIEDFLPYRNEIIQIFVIIAQYNDSDEYIQIIHRFFEKLIPYMSRPQNVTRWSEWDFDNYRFIIHELFLYVLSIMIKYNRFENANFLLQQQYSAATDIESGLNKMVNFTVFRENLSSLTRRNKRLNLGRLSLRADLLKERCVGIRIDFRQLLQADFVAFMRAEIESQDSYRRWWPETLLYVDYHNSSFEIFARAISKSYFEKVKVLLGIDSKEELAPLLASYQRGARQLPRWDFTEFNPASLLGYDNLATRL